MCLTITLCVVPLHKAAIADKEIEEKGETVSNHFLSSTLCMMWFTDCTHVYFILADSECGVC